MKYKDYIELMKTPFDKLSKEDQQIRTLEFNRRMKMVTKFLDSIKSGIIDKEFIDLMEDDDPMKEAVKTIKITITDTLGAKA